MSDPGLQAYIAALEADLTRRRGRAVTLNPPEFALVRGWFAAGVGLGDVLAALDAQGDRPRLAACTRVLRGTGPGSLRAAAPAPPLRSPLRAALLDRGDVPAEVLAHADGEALEDAVDAWAVALLADDERATLAAKAEALAARLRGRVSADALRASVARHLADEARDRVRLPRHQ